MKNRVIFFGLFGADFILLTLSFLLSSYWFHVETRSIVIVSILFLATKILLFAYHGLYRAILRFAGLPLAVIIIKASLLSSLTWIIASKFLELTSFNLGFFAMDFLFTTFFVGLIRFTPRYLSEARQPIGLKKVLIYGAGDLGEDVVRKLLRNPEEYQMVGFIDDDPKKISKRLHNFPIYGPISDLASIIAKENMSELIIAISSLEGDTVRFITKLCRKNEISCRIVPSFPDMLLKDVDIKNIDIADLLRREPKDLDAQQIRRFIQNKTILITGAGGSIGSEIARQCLRFGVRKLVLVDHSEFNLYSLQEELNYPDSVRFVLLNVLEQTSLNKCFEMEKPEIVFHAAAYKHVPIVEENPFEGIINNVKGTRNVAELSAKHGVFKFVLISTDKAVRPTSIMGASKRICELLIQNLNNRNKTEYISVRFGNVLGSSGSVIPKFLEQIRSGGPVTVTHPDVTRYFMLIPEAVQLVMQAGSIGNGGEIFILNMGKPICIADMAEDLIFLSGRKPHEDIKIEYTGLRAGEKLYEELLHDEAEKKTQYENITIGHATFMEWEKLTRHIESLLEDAEHQDRTGLLETIKSLVPEFAHADLPATPSASSNIVSFRTIQK